MSLDNAARQWGERQVRRMLHDRPMMAEHGDKAKVLYEWAARKFAGKDLRAQIVSDASTPSTDAESRGQIDGKSGVIRVRGTYYDGPRRANRNLSRGRGAKLCFNSTMSLARTSSSQLSGKRLRAG